MIMMKSHDEFMNDDKLQEQRIQDFRHKRKPYLKKLDHVEKLIKALAPLPCSYDIGRIQQPYFNEFAYTEMMGGMIVTPQNSTTQAYLIEMAKDDDGKAWSFDVDRVLQKRLKKEGDLDKYQLEKPHNKTFPKKVIFPPGTNAFGKFVSREILSRLMFEDQEIVIKPHPLSDEGLLRVLGGDFGYHRILEPRASGWEYLINATEVWCCASTEMGLYATYLKKPINNIGNFFTEAVAVYNGFYRVLWKLNVEERYNMLLKILTNPLSGWMHPDDNDLEGRLKCFFAAAMHVREMNRPLVMDIPNHQFQVLCNNPDARIQLLPNRRGRKGPPPPNNVKPNKDAPIVVEEQV